ncbi:DUF2628 domain-containing protein [Salipaludibacillus aurantiacus]|uniref:DUF2628 domain-containing protein n=1 Tax=Salipaludibacillus aurantiacus TaxID=1601833 RepID=A0A1H9WS50_9BACI|nr:DUF2628 domain-containing protein [Salipaludibacillus aurantiacus]SES36609.1 Protein of unknown function [Salipaludibacillus aurantiacus]
MNRPGPYINNVLLTNKNPVVQSIIEKNTSYYTGKWQKYKNPGVYSGWNWPAFFFTPFWLAYRHMYVWVMVFFLLYLSGIAVIAFLPAMIYYGGIPEYVLPVWQMVYPVLINVFFGLKGNALYGKRTAKLVQWKEGKIDKPMAPLFTKTGGSWLSAFVTPAIVWLLLFVPYQTVDSWVYNPPLEYGVYVYSDDKPSPQGVLDVKRTPSFEKYSARINFLYYGDEPVDNRRFDVLLFYKEEEDNSWTLERERTYTFFTSDRVSLDLIDAEDPAAKTGKYRLEIHIDGSLEAEEEFTITPPQ